MEYYCPKCCCDQVQGHICAPTRYEQEEWRLQGGYHAPPEGEMKNGCPQPNLAMGNSDWRWQ